MAWDDRLDHWPRALPTFRLNLSNTALLVIDMQMYAADPAMGLGEILTTKQPDYAAYYFPRMKNVVIPNIARLLTHFREQGGRIVFLTIGPECPDGADFRLARRRSDLDRQKALGKPTFFPKGTPGHAIVPELSPKPGELVINKRTASAFSSTGIDHMLRALGISELVCTGFATEACVESTARSAADFGYLVLLVEDACLTYDQQTHDATLRCFARNFGRVADTASVIQELSSETAQAQSELR